MTLSTSIAVYPGTFDPITNGHLDILQRALAVFQTVIVTIAPNMRKNPLFTTTERMQFIRDALPQYGDRLEFAVFEGLLVDFCRRRGATVIVIEHDRRNSPPETIGSLLQTDQRRYGDTLVSFYRVPT